MEATDCGPPDPPASQIGRNNLAAARVIPGISSFQCRPSPQERAAARVTAVTGDAALLPAGAPYLAAVE